MTALENNIQSIVIPAFGGGCGLVPPQIICEMMYEAYKQVMNPPDLLDWHYARMRRLEEV